MTELLAYRHFQGKVVHLSPECPEGKLIGIAKRDSVDPGNPDVMRELEWCDWCRGTQPGE